MRIFQVTGLLFPTPILMPSPAGDEGDSSLSLRRGQHLSDVSRIEKLFSLAMVAFVWAYLVGIYLHENVKQIKVKKHGNMAKSFFKYGVQAIANVLLNPWVLVHDKKLQRADN